VIRTSSSCTVNALYVVDNALVTANRTRIVALALSSPPSSQAANLSKLGASCPTDQTTKLFFCALPTMSTRFYGGQSPVISRSSSRPDFELVINLKTAKTIGLSLPESLLLLADKVIE
jgi:putative tryptophan/tyrosine transport system substrate-binding protein